MSGGWEPSHRRRRGGPLRLRRFSFFFFFLGRRRLLSGVDVLSEAQDFLEARHIASAQPRRRGARAIQQRHRQVGDDVVGEAGGFEVGPPRGPEVAPRGERRDGVLVVRDASAHALGGVVQRVRHDGEPLGRFAHEDVPLDALLLEHRGVGDEGHEVDEGEVDDGVIESAARADLGPREHDVAERRQNGPHVVDGPWGRRRHEELPGARSRRRGGAAERAVDVLDALAWAGLGLGRRGGDEVRHASTFIGRARHEVRDRHAARVEPPQLERVDDALGRLAVRHGHDK
mmetsp:Transcript_14215/g.56678  ORF Transcript_14215/g.56678 Transcript_14215/m.56678 type:complete len:287 (+) Transcript_14215:485-1345(+)